MNEQKNLTPAEVKESVSLDLKKKRISRTQAAKDLGYANRQSFYNLLSENVYFPAKVALRMHLVYGYDEKFLTCGEGTLYEEPAEDPGEGLISVAAPVIEDGALAAIVFDVAVRLLSISGGISREEAARRVKDGVVKAVTAAVENAFPDERSPV